ncbi:MAG: hypothetical protein JJ969_12400 [Rhizobiaceae bacterium]|nr:hypothetical protein [Rhizobiaceae bacterium]
MTKMDLLARDVSGLLAIVDDLESRKIALRILDFADETINTGSASGSPKLQYSRQSRSLSVP